MTQVTGRPRPDRFTPLLNSPPLSFVRRHAGAVAAVMTFVLITGRVLAMARFDTSVAVAIAGYVDPAKALLGIVVDLSPILVTCGVMILLAWTFDEWRRGGRRNTAIALTVMAVLVVLLIASVVYVLLLVVYFLILLVLLRTARLEPGRPTTAPLLGFVGLAIIFALTPLPWLTPERIETTPGTYMVGYVLGFSGEWVAVLEDTQRTVAMIRQDDIAARTPCAIVSERGLPRGLRQPLPNLLAGRQPILPPCR